VTTIPRQLISPATQARNGIGRVFTGKSFQASIIGGKRKWKKLN